MPRSRALSGRKNAGLFQTVAGGVGRVNQADQVLKFAVRKSRSVSAERVQLRLRPSPCALRRRKPCLATGGCQSFVHSDVTNISFSRLAWAFAMTKPTSVAMAPMSAT